MSTRKFIGAVSHEYHEMTVSKKSKEIASLRAENEALREAIKSEVAFYEKAVKWSSESSLSDYALLYLNEERLALMRKALARQGDKKEPS